MTGPLHTPQSLADVLERDYFPMPDGAQLYLTEYEWRMVIAALRASPSEADRKDAERWRKARMIFAVEDIERADAEMAGFTATNEENEKADAAIDAARVKTEVTS